MKNMIILFLGTLILSSCSSDKKDKIQQERLRMILGSNNHSALNDLLNCMDEVLEKTYKKGNKSLNYTQYLNDTSNDSAELLISDSDCLKFKTYENSELENKYLHQDYDTVYADNRTIHMIHQDGTSMELYVVADKPIEEIIKKTIDKGYMELIQQGRLISALDSLTNKDTILLSYVNSNLTNSVFASKRDAALFLKESKIDFNENYLYRVILLREIFFWEKKKYGC